MTTPPPSPTFDVKLMRKRREINPGFSSPTHISPSNGRTSVSWRRGSRHAERQVGEEGGGGGGGGVRMRERAERASERASGPAQGSAPPADKRSILSISLSALDNKQKFNRPSSCLAFEMCGSHTRLHSHPSGAIVASRSHVESPPLSLKTCTNTLFYPILLMKTGNFNTALRTGLEFQGCFS